MVDEAGGVSAVIAGDASAALDRNADPNNFFSFQPGFVVCEGQTVCSVVLVSRQHVVYNIREEFATHWTSNSTDTGKSVKLSEIEAALSEANNKLKNVFNGKVDALYTAAVCAVFENYAPEDVDAKIKSLKDEVAGLSEYPRVIKASARVCIWINEDLTVGRKIRHPTRLEQYACERLGQVEAYREIIFPEGLPSAEVKKMSINLAVALQSALSQADKDEVDKIFDDLEVTMKVFVENIVKSKYIIMTSAFSVALIAFAYFLYKMQWVSELMGLALVPVAGGFLGALLSVMSRADAVEISEQNPDKIILLQGAARIMVGGAFALVGFACVEANLALGMFKGDLHSLLVLGVMCGFSERLVPDLIGGLSTSAK